MPAPKFEIGTPGYYAIGTDIYPVTLVKQSPSGRTVWVQYDTFVGDVENGHEYFGHQVWKITRDESSRIERYDWSEKSQSFRSKGCGWLRLGQWRAHQDPGF